MAKVLLVDNQDHMVELLRSKFELEEFEVLSAGSSAEAIELAEREMPDLIVLDERLQDDNGVAVADLLKESAAADIPVILLTSRPSEGNDEVKGDGSASTLQLPFRPSQLLAIVRENL